MSKLLVISSTSTEILDLYQQGTQPYLENLKRHSYYIIVVLFFRSDNIENTIDFTSSCKSDQLGNCGQHSLSSCLNKKFEKSLPTICRVIESSKGIHFISECI